MAVESEKWGDSNWERQNEPCSIKPIWIKSVEPIKQMIGLYVTVRL